MEIRLLIRSISYWILIRFWVSMFNVVPPVYTSNPKTATSKMEDFQEQKWISTHDTTYVLHTYLSCVSKYAKKEPITTLLPHRVMSNLHKENIGLPQLPSACALFW